ncbi:O-antigen ligase family protein [Spirosoma pollinicola]|uniref:O-antigen ligase family protein n=1 Tax=Spirosoma pollinicola TaxID=2057025 RepID=UPI0012FE7265|nr:O-antigen ligase family protein [Spirosoma pollinicola]
MIKTLPIVTSALALFYFLIISNGNYLFKTIKENLMAIFLLLLILVGNVRSNFPDQTIGFTISRTINTVLLFSAVFSAFHYYKNKYNYSIVDIVAKFIILPYCLYCLINFLLWAAGISIKESVMTDEVVNKKAVLLSYFGLNIDRVQFPLSTGLNNYAVISGAMFTICLVLLFVSNTKKYKILTIASCLVFLATLLLIDSRASIYYPILICFTLILWQKSKAYVKNMPYLTYLIVLGPLFLYLMVPLMMVLPFIESITRNSEELATGNSRFLIWSACLLEFIEFKPIHLIGFGYFGHFGSGVSASWSSIFSTWTDGDLKTSHNTFFTILFDHGYLGLVVYVLVIYNTFKRISRFWNINREGNVLLFGFFSFNIFAGITETLIGFYSPNYFILFFVFLFAEFVGNSPILVTENATSRSKNGKNFKSSTNMVRNTSNSQLPKLQSY